MDHLFLGGLCGLGRPMGVVEKDRSLERYRGIIGQDELVVILGEDDCMSC